MSKQAGSVSGIHKSNAFSDTEAIQLSIYILLFTLLKVHLQSEYWMMTQSHIRGCNHVVMEGNLAHDKLLSDLRKEEWSCDVRNT